MSLFTGPEIAACTYLGYVKEDCGFPGIDVSCLPEACTSIIYDGVYWI